MKLSEKYLRDASLELFNVSGLYGTLDSHMKHFLFTVGKFAVLLKKLEPGVCKICARLLHRLEE